MPVAGVARPKSPSHSFGAQPGFHIWILGNVKPVIEIDEIVPCHRPINRHRQQKQNRCDTKIQIFGCFHAPMFFSAWKQVPRQHLMPGASCGPSDVSSGSFLNSYGQNLDIADYNSPVR
jgi:hypothetical protein